MGRIEDYVAVTPKRKRVLRALPTICLSLAIIAYMALNWDDSGKPPWESGIEGDSFSFGAGGTGGEYYAIDSGGARLLSFERDGAYRWDASPGLTMRLIAASPSGSVWVTGYEFDDSERIARADILEYTRHGRLARTLLSRSYGEGGYGGIGGESDIGGESGRASENAGGGEGGEGGAGSAGGASYGGENRNGENGTGSAGSGENGTGGGEGGAG
ncbi:MAG: hypothetical protein LBJ10_01110, partial [Clostridiales bacterium]|nr:hypothetical protein [Clostridiales bacterium]